MRRNSCLWLSNTTFCWYALPRGLSGNLRVNKMPVCGITVRQPGVLGSQSVPARKVGPGPKSRPPHGKSVHEVVPAHKSILRNKSLPPYKSCQQESHRTKTQAQCTACSPHAGLLLSSSPQCRGLSPQHSNKCFIPWGRPAWAVNATPPLPRSARVHTHRPLSGADKRLQQHTPMCARQSGQNSNELRPNEWRVPKHCIARV